MVILEAGSGYRRFLEEYCGGFIRRYIMESRAAFVAGGALISMLDKTTPRDVDIYLPSISPGRFKDVLRRNIGRGSSEYSYITSPHGEEYTGPADCLYLKYNGAAGGRATVMQLVFWPLCDVLNVLSGFDIELCKVAVYGGLVIRGSRFSDDYNDRIINLGTVADNKKTYDRIRKYMDRGYNPSAPTIEFMKSVERHQKDLDAGKALTVTAREEPSPTREEPVPVEPERGHEPEPEAEAPSGRLSFDNFVSNFWTSSGDGNNE